MKRCQETAAILYPGQNQEIIENFRECDFGIFENKNYQELSGNPAYQSWIDSGGKAAFPGGEAPTEFCRRSREAFERCVKLLSAEGVSSAAFVVHGGTIMSILETYGEPKQDFYAWHVENGCGYCMTVHPDKNGTIRCSELCRIENSR
jgi:alpha-ribazole phosphatase